MAENTTVGVTLKVDARDYTKGVEQASKATARADREVKGLQSSLGKNKLAWLAMGAGATLAGSQIMSALNNSVNVAGGLNKATTNLGRTFGLASVSIKSFANDSVQALGMSKRATYEATVQIGQLAKNAGLSNKASAEYSTNLTRLASQMATFKGTSVEQAVTSITQAMNGGTQGVAQYGVVINEAVLRQRAFDMGLIASTKTALTPYARALAVQAELLEQTGPAQQAAADGQTTLAEAQMRYAASLEDMQAALGDALLPLMTEGLDIATALTTAFADLPEPIRDTTAVLTLLTGGFLLLAPTIGTSIGMLKSFVTWATAAKAAGSLSLLGPAGLVAGAAGAAAWGVSKSAEQQHKMMGHDENYDYMAELKAADAAIAGYTPEIAAVTDEATVATEAVDGLAGAVQGAGNAAEVAAPQFDRFGLEITASYQAAQAATEILFGYINAQIRLGSATDALAGRQDRLRKSILGPATRVGGGGGGGSAGTRADTDARKANAKAIQEQIDALRKKDQAEVDAEIKAARRTAQRKAEARADAGARADAKAGVKKFIETDKAAKRGEDINGFNNTNSVGEATGSMTEAESKALDNRIDGIRAKHKKALDEQIKGMREVAKSMGSAAKSSAAAGQAYLDASSALDKHSEAGLRNRAAIRDEIATVAQAGQAAYDAAIAAGKGPEEAGRIATQVLEEQYDLLMLDAEAAGFAKDEVEKYLETIALAKTDIVTRFDLDTTPAERAMARLMEKWKKEYDWTSTGKGPTAPVPAPKPPTTPTTTTKPRPTWDPVRGGYYATGGEVGGKPGRDQVPIWATRGEFIVNDRSYAANRELVRAINAGNGATVGSSPLVGQITVTAARPEAAGQNVIDSLAEAAYRMGGVR